MRVVSALEYTTRIYVFIPADMAALLISIFPTRNKVDITIPKKGSECFNPILNSLSHSITHTQTHMTYRDRVNARMQLDKPLVGRQWGTLWGGTLGSDTWTAWKHEEHVHGLHVDSMWDTCKAWRDAHVYKIPELEGHLDNTCTLPHHASRSQLMEEWYISKPQNYQFLLHFLYQCQLSWLDIDIDRIWVFHTKHDLFVYY